MRYVVVTYDADGTIHICGTPSGQPFASFEAAKAGRERLIIQGASLMDTSVAPLERIENL